MATALQKIDESIEEQQKKLAQLKARKQAIEAKEKSAAQKEKRATETRRKILLGAFVLSHIERVESVLNYPSFAIGGEKFSDYLTRDDDRALFGFSAAGESAQSKSAKKPTNELI